MNYSKKSKNEKEESKKDIKESNKEESTTSRKIVKPVISFDNYFARMLKEDPKVLPHHKAPMRAYAEQHNLMSGTLDEFQRLFRLY